MGARHEVIQAAEARASALAAGDAGALRRLLHADFRWTSYTGDTFTRQEYIRRNTTGAVRWRSQQLDDIEVTVVGDTAVLRAETIDVILVGQKPQTFRMPVTQTWVRNGDGWRCLSGHAGPRRSG
jgi:uncharacterized protein (TIGR02246 family)